MLKMVDGTGIIGVDMICPLGVSSPQPPNYDRVELEGTGMLVLPNSLDAPLERLELGGKTEQVQTSGKNLFDESKNEKGYYTGGLGTVSSLKKFNGWSWSSPLNVIQNTTLSVSVVAKIKSRFQIILADDLNTVLYVNSKYSASSAEYTHSFNVVEGTTKILISVYEETSPEGVTIMLNEGVVPIPYEPYTGGKPSPSPEYPQEIKNSGKWNEETQKYEVDVKVTNAEQNWSKEQTLTLTSDRPITKWDKLVEQGGQIGWLYGTKKYTVTGSENYIFGGAQYYSGISTNMYITAVKNMSGEGVCRRLKSIIGIWDKSNNTKDGFCINSGNQIHMRFFNNLLGVSDDATMEEKKAAYIAYLKKEYEKGTPYEIVYQSLEPEFIPLPQSEQNAIRALKTYYPTTVITADGGEVDPDIKVTYRKEI